MNSRQLCKGTNSSAKRMPSFTAMSYIPATLLVVSCIADMGAGLRCGSHFLVVHFCHDLLFSGDDRHASYMAARLPGLDASLAFAAGFAMPIGRSGSAVWRRLVQGHLHQDVCVLCCHRFRGSQGKSELIFVCKLIGLLQLAVGCNKCKFRGALLQAGLAAFSILSEMLHASYGGERPYADLVMDSSISQSG